MVFIIKRRLRLILLALLLPWLASCGPARDTTVVLAASSMQEAMEDVATAWSAKGNAAPTLSFAASSALARQVEGGAPADIFVSADEEWMNHLQQRGLIRTGTRRDLLANDLVLIAPAAPADLVDGGRIALADPQAVPAGRYAKATLEGLGEWNSVKDRVVPAENVRAVLALVERGEVARGIVYGTDAIASGKVRVIRRYPASSHPPIRYPVALLSSSTSPDAAGFLAFLESPDAQTIFTRRGFTSAE